MKVFAPFAAILIITFLIQIKVYQLCPSSPITANCLPCPINCKSCSSQDTCITCETQYYSTVINGSTLCQPCPDNCLSCTSNICSLCMNPYVLTNNTCTLCVISNALSCSSTVAASSCENGYYLSDSYCKNCLLNCITCSSASDCSACKSGYYLNVSVLTCNPCPAGCSSCNQYTPTYCTSCENGYQLDSSNSCTAVTCSISNCQYCSSNSSCAQCASFYYWDGNSCVKGSSITCEKGSVGALPTHCINSCTSFGFSSTINGSFQCKAYKNLYYRSAEYQQVYYYAYNNLKQLNTISTALGSLLLLNNGQYSYPTNVLKFTSLSNYYRISISLKYQSSANILLSINATTPASQSQRQSQTLSAAPAPFGVSFSTVVVHSNNLWLSFNSTINLIEISLRLFKCSSECTVCLNQQLCQLCNTPNFMLSYNCVTNCSVYFHFLPNRTCLTSCPDGYYSTISNSLKYCVSCTSPCQYCTNSTFCLSCLIGYYYYNYTCLTSCPSQYFKNATMNTCQSCISPCQTCTSQSTCLSCNQGFWNGSSCSNVCPAGYYGDSTNHICAACSVQCLTCINSPSTCASCQPNYIFYNRQCLKNCPSRYYNSNGTCQQCLSPCYTCLSASFCLTCSYNYLFNGSCLSICPKAYYINQASLTCSPCLSECATCDSSTSCTSCAASTCLHVGRCLSTCPNNFYYPIHNSNGSCGCSECVYPCNQCNSSSYCLTCLQGYLLNGSCINQCPSGYFANKASAMCQICNSSYSNCLICTESACQSCTIGFYLLQGQCVATCPSLYYQSNTQCKLCVAPCNTCQSATKCLTCINPYILNAQSCLIQCPTNYIAISANSSMICVVCTPPCLSCSILTTNCTYCRYGYYLFNNLCYSNCSALLPTFNYYNEMSTLQCSLCSFPCKTCLSQTQCLSCKIGYLNTQTSQCQQCSIGTYPQNGTCIECPSSCQICYSSTYCISCKTGFYLFGNSCISNSTICQINGYYVAGRVCYPCVQPCNTCSLSSSNCTSCTSGYIFTQPNQCLVSCATGYYRSADSCLMCDNHCTSCTTTSYYCLTCASPYVLFLANASCLISCPSMTFLAGSVCSACQYPCLTCSSQSTCLSCSSGVLIGSQCYSSCLSGYYANINLVCQLCISPCKQCISLATNCTQCIAGYFLINNTCISSCPSTFFGQSQSGKCLQCLPICQECSSYVNCTSCSNNQIYFYSPTNGLGECISTCPSSYYFSNNSNSLSCISCNSQCLTCNDNISCILCVGSLVQYLGDCLNNCPSQMYSAKGICNQCVFPCLDCIDAYTCTSCQNSSYLLVANSSCVLGPSCPAGYYLLVNSSVCNSKCPAGFYNLNNRTCNSISCDLNEFMGADMFCYSVCPSNYIGNSSFHCVPCTDCSKGLFYQLSSAIIKDQFYIYLIFTQTPIYKTNTPFILLTPDLPYTIVNLDQGLVAGTTIAGSLNMTFLINVNKSIQSTHLTIQFNRPLQTFSNPLQKSTQTIKIEGFDYYPASLPDMSMIGVFVLICAIVGLYKNPYMTDFAQVLFLMALVNYHYPFHLASFLESTGIAHFHNIISVQQVNSLGEGKFLYVANNGLLSNTLTNWVIIGTGLILMLIAYLVVLLLRRSSYNKIGTESINDNQQSLHAEANEESMECWKIIWLFLENRLTHAKMEFINRFIYFNYAIISMFTFTQLTNFSTQDTLNTISSLLAIASVIMLLAYPYYLKNDKPKYTFLYARKLMISAAIILSLQNAIYAIGIISVCNLTAAILILTHKKEKYRWETRFLAVCELLQLFIQVCFSFFIMIGEGNRTSVKVLLGWMIIFSILIVLSIYLCQTIFHWVIEICIKTRQVDYRKEWVLNDIDETEKDVDSQSNSASKKEVSVKSQQKQDNQNNLQTMLIKIKQQIDKVEPPIFVKSNRELVVQKQDQNKNELFWAYNQSDQDDHESDHRQVPQMLIRCVNEFSDYNSQKQK